MCDSVNQRSAASSQQSALRNQESAKAKARERRWDDFLMQGRSKGAGQKIGACQSRADQQAPFEQRSLHTFISERVGGRHRIFQRVNPVTGCAF